jgi:hypothetical protein
VFLFLVLVSVQNRRIQWRSLAREEKEEERERARLYCSIALPVARPEILPSDAAGVVQISSVFVSLDRTFYAYAYSSVLSISF